MNAYVPLLVWIGFVCGLVMIGIVGFNIYLGLSAKKWPTTTGKVVMSEVVVGGDPWPNSPKKFYFPMVVYEYRAAGRQYRSRRLGNFALLRLKRAHANSIVAKFPRDGAVKVYYHKLFPALSALMPGVQQPAMHLFFLSIGVVFSTIFSMMLFP